jgi:hypothetical protein
VQHGQRADAIVKNMLHELFRIEQARIIDI